MDKELYILKMVKKCKQKINYKNGLKVGDYYQYFEDGTLATKGFFVNGKEEGVFELYNREGKKIKELVFKKGKKIEEREIKQ